MPQAPLLTVAGYTGLHANEPVADVGKTIPADADVKIATPCSDIADLEAAGLQQRHPHDNRQENTPHSHP
jgi:hypothetical protein